MGAGKASEDCQLHRLDSSPSHVAAHTLFFSCRYKNTCAYTSQTKQHDRHMCDAGGSTALAQLVSQCNINAEQQHNMQHRLYLLLASHHPAHSGCICSLSCGDRCPGRSNYPDQDQSRQR